MRRRKRSDRRRVRRGIYVLPNIFTSLNLFCGFFAVISSIDGKFIAAAVAILVAAVFDLLDGKIARATNTTSQFGIEYDSLADLVSFGLAPGLMIYLWALQPLGRIGWLAGFLFMACGALRLARFNTQAGSSSGKYFTGLPIPAGASTAATVVLFSHRIGFQGTDYPIVMLILLYVLSFLMVSTIKYFSFKDLELFKRINFNVLVATILVLIFVAAQPSLALLLFWIGFILSGPINYVRHHRTAAEEDAKSPETENHSSFSI